MERTSYSSIVNGLETVEYGADKLSKFFMLILALSPIIVWYDIHFPVGLGYMLILLLSAFVIARNRFRVFVMPKAFWLTFVYVCIMWIYNNNGAIWTLFPPGGWLFFLFVLAVIGGTLSYNLNFLKKYMRIVLLIAIALFWVQFFMMITTGSQQICFVPRITGQLTYEGMTYSELVAHQLRGERPCSIFMEPSYMAYYSLAYLVLEWFGLEAKQKWLTKEVALIFVTLLALRSGSGMVCGAILFAVKMFSVFWNASIGRRIGMLLFLIPLIAGSFFVYQRSEAGQAMLARSTELSTENTSGYSRVVAGYLLFSYMSPSEQMIEIGRAHV